MTDTTLSAYGASFVQSYDDEVAHLINRKAKLLSILPVVLGEGKNHGWEVYPSDSQNAGTFTEGATKSTTASDVPIQPYLDWASYDANFKLTHHAINAARGSKNPRQLQDLVFEQMRLGLSKLFSAVNAALYNGSGSSGACVGLETAIDSTTTYANINRGTYTAFGSYEADSSSALLTTAQIEDDLATIMDNCGERPNVMLMRSSLRNKVKRLFADNVRWMKAMSDGDPRMVLNNSADLLVIDGCTVIEDKDATASQITYLNTNEASIIVLPQDGGNGDQVPLRIDGPDNNLTRLSRGLTMYELGKTGSFRQFSIEFFFALRVRNPRTCGKRVNVG